MPPIEKTAAPSHAEPTSIRSGDTLGFSATRRSHDTLRYRALYRYETNLTGTPPPPSCPDSTTMSGERSQRRTVGATDHLSADCLPGDVIAERYELQSLLGKGSMGVVWRARDREVGTQVAVKLVSADLLLAAEAADRLRDEAAVLTFVDSPHVASVLGTGRTAAGAPYLVTELLEGVTLQQAIEKAPSIAVQDAIAWMSQAADGLADIHEHGIVHNDLKPSNVFLAQGGANEWIVKLLDFGVAQIRERPARRGTSDEVFGHPSYVAPERVLGASGADHRADIWSLGVILYELLTKRRPFEGETIEELCARVVEARPAPLRQLRPEISPALEAIVLRCLRRRPEERYLSARLLSVDLQRLRLTDVAPPMGASVLATERRGDLPESRVSAAPPLGTNAFLESQAIVRAKLNAILHQREPDLPFQRQDWVDATLPPRPNGKRRRLPALAAYSIPFAALALVLVVAASYEDSARRGATPAVESRYAAHPVDGDTPTPSRGATENATATHSASSNLSLTEQPTTPRGANDSPPPVEGTPPNEPTSALQGSVQASPPMPTSPQARNSERSRSSSPPKPVPMPHPNARRPTSATAPPVSGVRVDEIYVNPWGELVDAQGRLLDGSGRPPDANGGTSEQKGR